MKFQQASLLSIVAASALSCSQFVAAEPMTRGVVSLQEVAQATIKAERLPDSSECILGYDACDPATVVSPALASTVEDDILLTLADLFSVRFGFGPAQPESVRADESVEWAPAFFEQFDAFAFQPASSAQIRAQRNAGDAW